MIRNSNPRGSNVERFPLSWRSSEGRWVAVGVYSWGNSECVERGGDGADGRERERKVNGCGMGRNKRSRSKLKLPAFVGFSHPAACVPDSRMAALRVSQGRVVSIIQRGRLSKRSAHLTGVSLTVALRGELAALHPHRLTRGLNYFIKATTTMNKLSCDE